MTQPPDSSNAQLYISTRPPNPSMTFLNFSTFRLPWPPASYVSFEKSLTLNRQIRPVSDLSHTSLRPKTAKLRRASPSSHLERSAEVENNEKGWEGGRGPSKKGGTEDKVVGWHLFCVVEFFPVGQLSSKNSFVANRRQRKKGWQPPAGVPRVREKFLLVFGPVFLRYQFNRRLENALAPTASSGKAHPPHKLPQQGAVVVIDGLAGVCEP